MSIRRQVMISFMLTMFMAPAAAFAGDSTVYGTDAGASLDSTADENALVLVGRLDGKTYRLPDN